jgi:hypothetical protein
VELVDRIERHVATVIGGVDVEKGAQRKTVARHLAAIREDEIEPLGVRLGGQQLVIAEVPLVLGRECGKERSDREGVLVGLIFEREIVCEGFDLLADNPESGQRDQLIGCIGNRRAPVGVGQTADRAAQ